MRWHLGWIAALLIVGLLSNARGQGIGPGGQGGPGQTPEDQVKKALEAFNAMYKEGQQKKDENKRTQAIQLVVGFPDDDRVINAIERVLATSNETSMVKTSAAQLLGQSKSPKALAALDKAFGGNEKNDCANEIVRQMGQTANIADDATKKKAVQTLERIVMPRVMKSEDEKAGNVAQAAIEALGRVKTSESVEMLLKVFASVENGKPPAPDPNDKNAPKPTPEEEKKENRRKQAEGWVTSALTSITGQNQPSYDDWKKWWSTNKKGWKPQ